ncbi:hypothetical protein Q9189_008202 [Teloschistes chrysophthalmus]
MDPVSISAAVAGLLTAAVSVNSLVQKVAGMSELAKGVTLEVQSVTACIRSLQRFTDGTTTAPRSRTALIMIDEVRVVLTECVIVFSELQKVLDQLELGQKKRVWDVIKRASSIKLVEQLLHRLQGARVSLTLMLSTLSCVSAEEAAESSRELRSLVLKALDNNSDLATRFNDDQMPSASLLRGSSPSAISDDDHDTIRADPVPKHENVSNPTVEASIGFAFDEDLQTTRVYSRLTYRRSGLSLPSSAGRSRGWSFLSDVSLSEVTNISIISLPLTLTELSRGCQNHFRSGTPDVKRQPSSTAAFTQNFLPPAEIICFYGGRFAELVADLWPTPRVASAFHERGLISSVVENILTPTKPPYTLLLKKRADMDEYSSNPVRQELFWVHVTAVQNQIRAELRNHHWPNLYSMHEKLEKSLCCGTQSLPRPLKFLHSPWLSTNIFQESELIIDNLCMAAEFAGPCARVHEQASTYITIQAALDDALRFRKAGNQAFLKNDPWISIRHYIMAQRYIIQAQILSALAPTMALESAIAKTQVEVSWSEVINWLQLGYKGTVWHFQRAVNAADRALGVVVNYAWVWRLNANALEKLLLWRSLARKGLGQSVPSLEIGSDAEVLDTTLDFDMITDDETNERMMKLTTSWEPIHTCYLPTAEPDISHTTRLGLHPSSVSNGFSTHWKF